MGGEGTVEILGYHLKGEKQELFVKDPLFYSIKTSYLLSHDKKTVFIEMAKSSGIQLLPNIQRNPMLTTTYGVGEMIMHAINNGAKDILVFIAGSATIDAGIGMAIALGFEFYDSKGAKLSGIGKELIEIEKIIVQ